MVDQAILPADENARLNSEPQSVNAEAEGHGQDQPVHEAAERVQAGEAAVGDGEEDVLEHSEREDLRMLLVELDVLPEELVALVDVGLLVNLGQPVHQHRVLEVGIAWEGRHECHVVHFPVPSLLVADKNDEPAEASDIRQEEHERLQSLVPDAVAGPRAMVVHLVDAAVARAAVVYARHFLGAALLALSVAPIDRFRVSELGLLGNFMASLPDPLPLLAVFPVQVCILRRAEVVPLEDAWIVTGAGEGVRPVRHGKEGQHYS